MKGAHFVVMQIPRGTFRVLKKRIEFSTLLGEMKAEKFTGYCTINLNNVSILTVHQDGDLLLARCDDLLGDEAWQKIQGLSRSHVDAALSDLTAVQVQLTLEFNSAAKISHSNKIHGHHAKNDSGQKKHPQESPVREISQKSHEKPIPETPQISDNLNRPQSGKVIAKAAESLPSQTMTARPDVSHSQENRSLKREVRSQSPREVPLSSKDEFLTVNRDLDALDTLDLDSMTRKIKDNCQLIIQKLNLEHLMEKNEH